MVKDMRKAGWLPTLVHLLATEPSSANVVKLESDGQHVACEGSLVRPAKQGNGKYILIKNPVLTYVMALYL